MVSSCRVISSRKHWIRLADTSNGPSRAFKQTEHPSRVEDTRVKGIAPKLRPRQVLDIYTPSISTCCIG